MRRILRKFKKYYRQTSTHQHVGLMQRVRRPQYALPFVVFMVLLAFGAIVSLSTGRGNPPLQGRSPNLVVVTYDKEERTIPTDAKTVGELLGRMEIKLKEGDVVEPSVATEIASDNFRINVYRAMPVTIVDSTSIVVTQSAAATPRSIAKQAGIVVYPEDELQQVPTENFLTEGAIGDRVIIDRATPVELNIYGTQATVRTQAETVGELLKEKRINLGKDDSLLPDPEAKVTDGLHVYLVNRDTQIQTIEEEIAMPSETVEDPKLAYGTVALRQQGSPGKRLITYQIDLQNGQESGRKIIQEAIIQQPVANIVARGTAPLAISLQAWLQILRMCESSGNYQTNTGNGYYGAYQFLITTWDSIARRVRPDLVGVRPDQASPDDQDFMIITNTNLSKGGLATQNPGCYKKHMLEGLTQFPPANH